MPLVLLIGGARSGKSALALRLASAQSAPVVFVATAQAGDTEMAARITQHARERPPSWRTVEEPLRVREAIVAVSDSDCVVLDCLTLWTANALEALGAAEAEAHAVAAAEAAATRAGLTIAVTNEVGLGIVPDNALTRSYRDLLGRVNTIWAEAADHVYLLVAGRVLALASTDSLNELLP
jgi:adenosyl cobinamide kinase/adenosyl cobinamide phosphate guanylyltransferase